MSTKSMDKERHEFCMAKLWQISFCHHLGPGSRICCQHFAEIFGTDVVDAVVSQVYMANRKIGPWSGVNHDLPVAMASALIQFSEPRKTVQIWYPKHMKETWPRLVVDWNDWRIFNSNHILQPSKANISSLNCPVKMAHFRTSQRACMPLGSLPIAFLHHASAPRKHPAKSDKTLQQLSIAQNPLAFLELSGTTPLHYFIYTELEYPDCSPLTTSNHHERTEKLLNSEVRSISNWGSARICWS